MRPFRLTHKQKNTHKQTTSRLTLTQKKKNQQTNNQRSAIHGVPKNPSEIGSKS